jgi:hypothetical protein
VLHFILETTIGLAHTQLIKKNIGHVGIEVLARVDQDLFQLARSLESVRDYAGFDELWTCTQNGKDFFHLSD